jgi:hypothetical protein
MVYLSLYDSNRAVRYLAEMKPVPPEELVDPFRHYAGHVIDGMHSELAAGELDKYFSEGAEAAVMGARALSLIQQMAELLRARNTDRTRAAVTT